MRREMEYDLLKGLGIILVLIGHAHIGKPLFTSIYLFHMPLFFMVSGCFFNVKENENFVSFIRKKARRLLLPYFIFLLVFIFFNVLCAMLWPGGESASEAVKSKLIQFAIGIVGNEESLSFRTLWFLVCLFLVFVLYRVLAYVKNIELRTALSTGLFLAGYGLQMANINLPYFLDSTLTLQWFFHLGYLFRHSGACKFHTGSLVSIISLVILFVAFNCMGNLTDYRTNHFALCSIPMCLIIIWNLYNICFVLSQLMQFIATRLLNALGKESIVIYGMHRNFYILLDGLLGKCAIPSAVMNVLMIIIGLTGSYLLSGPMHRLFPKTFGPKS